MQRLRRFFFFLVIAMFGCASLVGTAAAASTAWSSQVNLSFPVEDGVNPSVSMNESGDAVAAWSAYGNIRSASKAAHGGWAPEVQISSGEEDAAAAGVGIDAAGDALAVWGASVGSGPRHRVVEAAEKSSGGAWGSPVTLYSAESGAGDVAVAVDPLGDAVALWTKGEGRTIVIDSASRPKGGEWSPAGVVSSVQAEIGYLKVAMDAAGDAVAIWDSTDGVEAAARPAGGGWASEVHLSTTEGSEPDIVVDPAGEAVAAWRDYVDERGVIDTATKPPGGAWSGATELSAAAGYESGPQLAIDPDGDVVAVWNVDHWIREYGVRSASRPAGGQWADAGEVASPPWCSKSPEARVGMEADGTAVAVWYCWEEYRGGLVESASMPLGEGWAPPGAISENEYVDQLRMGAGSGGAVALWRSNPKNIQAAALAQVHRFSVTVNGSGSGIVATRPAGISCGKACEIGVVEGEAFELIGSPTPGSKAVKWERCPGVVNSSGACEVGMGASEEEAVATFDRVPVISSDVSTPSPTPSPHAVPAPSSGMPPRPMILHGSSRQRSPNGTSYTFAFGDAAPGVSFVCSLDRGRFKVCSSPAVYRHLSPGRHLFRVEALDPGGLNSRVRAVGFTVPDRAVKPRTP